MVGIDRPAPLSLMPVPEMPPTDGNPLTTRHAAAFEKDHHDSPVSTILPHLHSAR